jgi:serine/threonine protein kinase
MFDFGFAVTVNEDNPNSLLDKCGTLRYSFTPQFESQSALFLTLVSLQYNCRYMAPEVGKCKENIVCPSGSFKSNFVFALPLILIGLGLGYGLEADIFSIGVIMWEVCSLKKPFAKVKSVAEFEELVFVKDSRPKIGKKWPTALKNLMSECWARDPKERPDMSVVKSILVALTEEQSRRNANANGRFLGQSIRSSIVRRVTWD